MLIRQRILNYIREHGPTSSRELAVGIGINSSCAQAWCSKLAKLGTLDATGGRRHRLYVWVCDPVPAARAVPHAAHSDPTRPRCPSCDSVSIDVSSGRVTARCWQCGHADLLQAFAPRAVEPRAKSDASRVTQAVRSAGSGVIAGTRIPEPWRPLAERDLFAHMRLALITRSRS